MFGELVPTGGGDNIPLRKNELTIGRKDDCDIVLRFSNVSSKHCRLILSNGYWYVQDLKSTNGVKVNGVRVDDRRVDPGVKLMIATNEYTIEYDPSELGAFGAPPPDVLDGDIFSKSLLERAGLQNSKSKTGSQSSGATESPKPEQKRSTNKEVGEVDYSMFTIDDIHFE